VQRLNSYFLTRYRERMHVVRRRRARSLLGDAGAGAAPLWSASAKFKDFNEQAAFLRKMSDRYAGDRGIRELAVSLARECPSREKECQALAIGRWFQDNVYYIHEGKETFQTPVTTIRELAGDCDDFTTGICSCLTSIGIKNAMCILQINGRWAHIFPVALIPVKGEIHRLTLDATLKDPIDDMVNPIQKIGASPGRKITKVKYV